MNDPRMTASGETRCAIVAMVGRANVGKSTLINRILGEKVSIVSPVAQTTRNKIRGVLTEPRGQLVFYDTPGVHKAQSDLGKLMNRIARSSVGGCDIAMLVLDGAQPLRDEDTGWIKRLSRSEMPVLVVVNKSDLGTRHEGALKACWDAAAESKQPLAWLQTSAREGHGVDKLLEILFQNALPGPQLFPEELLTDFPRKLAISDVIREKLNCELRDELPHAIAVFVKTFEEQADTWRIVADIYVNRSSQKGIVIGEKGRLLRRVKRQAVQDIEKMFDKKIDLDLWVKVQKDWTRNFWILRQLGYQ